VRWVQFFEGNKAFVVPAKLVISPALWRQGEVTYSLDITTPSGRRPGKVLRKLAPEGFGQDYSALVEAQKYSITEVSDIDTCKWVLKSCPSCQSEDEETMANYFNVWSKAPGVKIVALSDGVTPIARCLVNFKNGTYAPCYGEKHYLLESLLLFAELQEGEVASKECLEAIVDDVIPDPPQRGLCMRKITIPRYNKLDSIKKLAAKGNRIAISRLKSGEPAEKFREWETLCDKHDVPSSVEGIRTCEISYIPRMYEEHEVMSSLWSDHEGLFIRQISPAGCY
jgi:hypothetical protein